MGNDFYNPWHCVEDEYTTEESNNGTAVLTEGFHRVTLEYFEKSVPEHSQTWECAEI